MNLRSKEYFHILQTTGNLEIIVLAVIVVILLGLLYYYESKIEEFIQGLSVFIQDVWDSADTTREMVKALFMFVTGAGAVFLFIVTHAIVIWREIVHIAIGSDDPIIGPTIMAEWFWIIGIATICIIFGLFLAIEDSTSSEAEAYRQEIEAD